MQDLSKISVVLPSLDPDEKLNAVIDGLLEYGFSDIILVNDGSKQENLHYFTDAAAAHPEIHLIHHEVNRGKGAALKTAFRWFLDNCPEGVGARVLSSLLNFFLNKKLVFRSNADTGKTMLRYYCLAVPQMLLQILLTDGAYVLFHVKPTGVLHTLIYVVVMILLYIIGYMIQQRWVFAPQKQNEPEVEKK